MAAGRRTNRWLVWPKSGIKTEGLKIRKMMCFNLNSNLSGIKTEGLKTSE